jgi:hypothetical protein
MYTLYAETASMKMHLSACKFNKFFRDVIPGTLFYKKREDKGRDRVGKERRVGEKGRV